MRLVQRGDLARELGRTERAVAEYLVEHAHDVGRLVVDDPLLPLVPQDRRPDAALEVGVGRVVGLLEVAPAVQAGAA